MYHRSPPAVHHPERRPYSCGPKRCRGGAGHTSAAPQPAGAYYTLITSQMGH